MDNLVKRGRKSACFRNHEFVVKMAGSGATLDAIGRAIGTGKRHVRTYLTRHGIQRPQWRDPPTTSTSPMARATSGHLNHRWRGGRMQDKSGYWLIWMPNHPEANRHGQIREHRYLMSVHLGRPLAPGEVVDHVNGDKADNRIENLRLFASNGEHLRATLTGVPCPARGRKRKSTQPES